MFLSEMEGLQELAQLSPGALKVLADRYDRLAKLCRSRAKWLLERAAEADLARAAHEHMMQELARQVRALHRRGLSADAVAQALPQYDAAVVRYQFKRAQKVHREKNAHRPSRAAQPPPSAPATAATTRR